MLIRSDPPREQSIASTEAPPFTNPRPSAPSLPGLVSSFKIGRISGVVAIVLVSLLTYIGAHIWLKPALLNLSKRTGIGASESVEAEPSPKVLGLQVSRRDAALELTWNKLSPVIAPARSGKLVIVNGSITRTLDLDKDQLRSGRIFYLPSAGDVSFSLQVMDSGSHSVSESLAVLGSSGQSAAGPVADGTVPAPAQTNRPNETATDTGRRPVVAGNTRASARASLASSSIKKSDARLPNAVNSARTRNGHAETMEAVRRQDLDSSLVPQRSSTASANADDKTLLTPVKVLVPYYPAVPEDGSNASPHKEVFVPVTVSINTAGVVTAATLSPAGSDAPPALVEQALAAARRWRFSPARVGNTPIATEQEISFHFPALPQ